MTTSTASRAALIKHRILFRSVLVLGLGLSIFEFSRGNYFEATVMSLGALLAVHELNKSVRRGWQKDSAKNSYEACK